MSSALNQILCGLLFFPGGADLQKGEGMFSFTRNPLSLFKYNTCSSRSLMSFVVCTHVSPSPRRDRHRSKSPRRHRSRSRDRRHRSKSPGNKQASQSLRLRLYYRPVEAVLQACRGCKIIDGMDVGVCACWVRVYTGSSFRYNPKKLIFPPLGHIISRSDISLNFYAEDVQLLYIFLSTLVMRVV